MPEAQPWTARIWLEFRAGNLTRAYRDVLLTLRTYRGHGGLMVPAHATLADRTGCSPRTVQRALLAARHLGLVSWTERRVRAAWRWLRTSNSYRLLTPDEPVQPGQRTPWPRRVPTNCQSGEGGESDSKKAALRKMLQEAAAVPDLLAMRQAANEARWLTGRSGQRVCNGRCQPISASTTNL